MHETNDMDEIIAVELDVYDQIQFLRIDGAILTFFQATKFSLDCIKENFFKITARLTNGKIVEMYCNSLVCDSLSKILKNLNKDP